LAFDYSVSNPSTLKWAVFTTAFRKVFEDSLPVNSAGTVVWNLNDKGGTPVANGLYYLRAEISGSGSETKILKVLIIR
jgi:hypothetical protein